MAAEHTRKMDVETLRAAAGEVWRFIRYVMGRAVEDRVMPVAASLSYTSLLAIVPLFAIGLSILAAFPVFEGARAQLQDMVFTVFVPHAGSQLQRQIESFVNASGQLGTAGVVGLAVTAIMLLVTVESAFNRVFRVARPRGVVSKLVVYWTVLTLGPLLLGASFSLSGYFASVDEWTGIAGLLGLVSGIMPTLLTWAAFSLFYLTVPNRRSRLRDAAIGGLAAALLFAVLRYGFVLFVSNSETYRTVYGAMAALPIFLVWMYMSWAVVVLGASITAALPEWRGQRAVRSVPKGYRRLRLAVDVLEALQRHARGGGGLGRRDLLDAVGGSDEGLRLILLALEEADFVIRTAKGNYVLARDLDAATLADLVRALDMGLPAVGGDSPTGRGDAVDKGLKRALDAEVEALDQPLKRLFAKVEPEGAA